MSPAEPPLRHLIGGLRASGPVGPTRSRLDPATGVPTATFEIGGAEDVAAAVAAARTAAVEWAATPAAQRAAALSALADAVAAEHDQLATNTARDMGRPVAGAAGGVDAAVGTIREYAVLGPLHRGYRLNGASTAWDVMERRPRGVAGVITAWNDPVAATVGPIAAALVTGNTVVWKPSERAPLTADRLTSLLQRCLPAGVVGTLFGNAGTGASLVAAGLDVIIHVGSTRAGRQIAAAAAMTGTRTVLENGGNDALVVDADVDPQWAAEQIALGAFVNAGQLCTGVERVYVHTDVYDEVREAVVAAARRWGPDGDDPIGPLVDTDHRDAVHAHVQAALDAGGKALIGGIVPDGPGAWYPPTVLTDVPADAALLREETFGPVVPLIRVPDFATGIEQAAADRYGLAATVLTADLAHAQWACRSLPVGTVKVNAVFGGAPGGAAHPRGDSGDGFGYGPELLDELTAVTVCHIGTATPRTR